MAHARAFTRESGCGLMAVVALDRSSWAWPSLALFVMAYALANVAAFAVVVALHGRTSIDAYRGLARRRP
jgi:NADH-quinone oxidoreductase subunit N